MDNHAEAQIPGDLADALKINKAAKDKFMALPPSHKKEYIRWIGEAKKAATRGNRIEKMLDMLINRK